MPGRLVATGDTTSTGRDCCSGDDILRGPPAGYYSRTNRVFTGIRSLRSGWFGGGQPGRYPSDGRSHDHSDVTRHIDCHGPRSAHRSQGRSCDRTVGTQCEYRGWSDHARTGASQTHEYLGGGASHSTVFRGALSGERGPVYELRCAGR